MLKKLSLWFDFQRDAWQSGMRILRKNWLATGMTIFTIVLLLSFAAILAMLSNVLHGAEFDLHNDKQITLYLKVPTTADEEQSLLTKVAATDGVLRAELRSSSAALVIMQEELGFKDILTYLPENPLPAAIDVTPTPSLLNSSAQLKNLFNTLKSYENVESAKLDIESIQRFMLFLNVIANIFKVLIILLVLALILVIANALRLIITDRLEEINVLKFVGASNNFIRRPYMYIGIFYGIVASAFTIAVVNFSFASLRAQINNLLSIYSISYATNGMSVTASLSLLIIAVLIGWFGAWVASRKYLNTF